MASFVDGVTVIGELTANLTTVDWQAQTPCTEWRAADLAGHLRCAVDNLGEYLDAAPRSRLASLMSQVSDADELGRKLARQNAAELAALEAISGPDSIAAFVEGARRQARRLPALWDRPYYVYRGIEVTVGQAAGGLCVEWHLHAWDLARSQGMDYRPADPETLLAGWRTGFLHLPPVTGRDAWSAILEGSGRSASWRAE